MGDEFVKVDVGCLPVLTARQVCRSDCLEGREAERRRLMVGGEAVETKDPGWTMEGL